MGMKAIAKLKDVYSFFDATWDYDHFVWRSPSTRIRIGRHPFSRIQCRMKHARLRRLQRSEFVPRTRSARKVNKATAALSKKQKKQGATTDRSKKRKKASGKSKKGKKRGKK